jgi:hypothetical protein
MFRGINEFNLKNIPYQLFSMEQYVEKILKLTIEKNISIFKENFELRQSSKESHVSRI